MFVKVTVITPPDVLFNSSLSYLLVKPSLHTKEQFQNIISKCPADVNVFIFDEYDTDIAWLMNAALRADSIIIDFDQCDQVTKQFCMLFLAHSETYYITSDDETPYGIISRNRIYDLDFMIERFNEEYNADDGDDDEDDE